MGVGRGDVCVCVFLTFLRNEPLTRCIKGVFESLSMYRLWVRHETFKIIIFSYLT